MLRVVLLIALTLAYTGQSLRYGQVWRSELTLWTWAADHAPRKPRPLINLAAALMSHQQYDRADAVLEYAGELLHDDTLPLVDTQDALKAISANRQQLALVRR